VISRRVGILQAAPETRLFKSAHDQGFTLADITKSDLGDLKPSGSSFWSNLARCSRNIMLASGDSPVTSVGIYHRKASLSATHPAGEHHGYRRSGGSPAALAADEVRGQASAHDRGRLANGLNAKVDTVERTARLYTRRATATVALGDFRAMREPTRAASATPAGRPSRCRGA
jgi:hypothetical protein